MEKPQEGSRRKVRGAMFAVIFCIALGFGLWFGAHGIPARAQQHKLAEEFGKHTVNSQSFFYCSTKLLSKEEWAHQRHISDKMSIARAERKELHNGYAFRFRPEVVSLLELADWVSSEARCCPFFAMGIEVQRDGGPLLLRLTGKEGVKQFIRMEFSLDGEQTR